MNYCILIQGPITEKQVKLHKNIWRGKSIIFSTWETARADWFDNNDIVLYNKIPEDNGISNLNLQKISTQTGCIKAKELGYEFVIKWRNDMFPMNSDLFLELFDFNKFNLYTWMSANHYNYLSDFFFGGNPDEIYDLFEGPIYGVNPEIVLSQNFFDKGYDKKEMNFIRAKLSSDTNDVIWTSHHGFGTVRLSGYRPGGGNCTDSVINKIKQ